MKSNQDNFPFYSWVPRPVGILILMFMFVPPTFSGGAYMSNLNEMVGGLGIWTEDIQLAGFFTSIGMCLFPPFMIRFLQARRVKQTYLYCFALLFLLNYICATTVSLPILLLTCLLTGFVRVIVMLNCTFTLAPYLTGMDTLSMFTMKEEPSEEIQYQLERKRTFLMPVLYFYILLISQASNLLTAWFAYEYQWQQAYYVVMGFLLFAMLLVVSTMPDEEKKSRYKVEHVLIPEMAFMTVLLCSLSYIAVYGKTLDWLDSTSIRFAIALSLFSLGGFLYVALQKREKHYLPLEIFRFRNIWMSMLLFFLCMLFNSASMFIGAFAKLSTPINNLQSASLSSWAIVGCFIGLLFSLLLVVRKVRFRTVFIVGFLLMATANLYMYFQYQSISQFDKMILPTVLNYAGLLILYALVAAFGMKSLPSRYLVTFVFLMIWMRNSIAPFVGSSIYSNWLNERQQHYITRLVNDTPLTDQTPVLPMKMRITKQATLLAMKDISGKTVSLLLCTTLVVFLLPYHRKETT